jgi:hypothetical protein
MKQTFTAVPAEAPISVRIIDNLTESGLLFVGSRTHVADRPVSVRGVNVYWLVLKC